MNVFDYNYIKYDSWFEKHPKIYKNELNMLSSFIDKNSFGLEIGVGTGRFAEYLNTNIGIDISLNMLKISKDKGIEVLLANGEKLPFNDSVFDYVLMIVTICFIKNPEAALLESRRVLKSKGKIYIAFIDKNSMYGKYYNKIKLKNLFYADAHFYSIKELEEKLVSSRFVINNYAQTLFYPPGIEKEENWKYGFGEGSFLLIVAEKS